MLLTLEVIAAVDPAVNRSNSVECECDAALSVLVEQVTRCCCWLHLSHCWLDLSHRRFLLCFL